MGWSISPGTGGQFKPNWGGQFHRIFHILGLVIAVVSITGSIIVYKPEIEKAMISEISLVSPLANTVSLDTLYQMVQRSRPKDKIQSVAMYGGPTAAWNFRCVPKDGGRMQVYVDQYRGKILGEVDFSDSWYQWIYDLHADLLGGKNGRVVNGIIGLLFGMICLTGLVIWWPGAPRVKHGFTYHKAGSWKSKNYDVHKLAGFYGSLLLILVTVTGAYFPFKQQYNNIAAAITGTAHTIPSPKIARPDTLASIASFETVYRNATRAAADAENSLLRFPQKPEENFSMRKLRKGDWGRIGDTFVYLHHNSGQVISVRLWDKLPAGVKLIESMFPLHFGTFGGHFTRILWVILGLLPGVLYYTGFVIWWNKLVKKQRNIT
ncbi:hypothetical protein DYBT9275_03710 [Dyadobacter sp. CECT 9275]|uniref:PepSY domain-containing protein n=1 Tax=Dyadobacter helix TaxID=2822344 RepID=A0A916JD60_9BACT|nr:PepSY-associated TM helix domain-containing protein [Dyadobacter sp. CECT 9275]CAG5006036.1 hypothetical protein DYBT9275_03710 [Dyadobacter sp. CECT 9275]